MNLGDVLFATDFSTASGRRAGIAANGLAHNSGEAGFTSFTWSPYLSTQATLAGSVEDGSSPRLTRGCAWKPPSRLAAWRIRIICYARDKRIGLIVLGTHGRTGVSHALLGSVAGSAVRPAPCPVLTVPATAGEAGNLVPAAELTAAHRCIVCVSPTEDLICETCRTRIRAEALEQKRRPCDGPGREENVMYEHVLIPT